MYASITDLRVPRISRIFEQSRKLFIFMAVLLQKYFQKILAKNYKKVIVSNLHINHLFQRLGDLMDRKDVLTTFEAAAVCHVSYNTIKNWIKRGLLSAYRTAGGHLRIRADDLASFSSQFGIPIYEDQKPHQRKVMIVGADADFKSNFDTAFTQYSEYLELKDPKNAFEAGLMINSYKPDVMIIDAEQLDLSDQRACQMIREYSNSNHSQIVILNSNDDVAANETFADATVSYTNEPNTIFDKISKNVLPKHSMPMKRRLS